MSIVTSVQDNDDDDEDVSMVHSVFAVGFLMVTTSQSITNIDTTDFWCLSEVEHVTKRQKAQKQLLRLLNIYHIFFLFILFF